MVLGEKMEKFQYMIRIKNAFKDRDSFKLREISNDAMKEAVLSGDKELANIAVLAYSLSKILSKLHFRRREEWKKFAKETEKTLYGLVGESKEGNLSGICDTLINLVERIDHGAGNYTRGLVFKARVKLASQAYALGLSLSSAAELTGADKYELTRYVGATKIHDRPFVKTISPADRYKIIKGVLRVKR